MTVAKRKVTNRLAVAVLAALTERQMHPYELASVLPSWGGGEDLKSKWGSLYSLVRNLEKHGLLEVVETVREGRRPERTVYQITEVGRAELLAWAGELIALPDREATPFEAGLSVLSVFSHGEATGLLRERLRALEQIVAAEQEQVAGHARDVPRLFPVGLEYALALREAEATWVRSFLRELDTGALPGGRPWQSYPDTGRMPPELLGPHDAADPETRSDS